MSNYWAGGWRSESVSLIFDNNLSVLYYAGGGRCKNISAIDWVLALLCTYTLLCCVRLCTHRNTCLFNIRRCQMVHTCRRSAKIIAVIWKSENWEWDETDIRGVLLCPQTLFFQAFLITLWGGEQCGTHTLQTPSESSTVGSFSTQKKERNQRVEARTGWAAGKKIWTPEETGTSSARAFLLLDYRLYKLDAKRVSTRPGLEAAFDYLLALWTFLFPLNVASYVSHPSGTGR